MRYQLKIIVSCTIGALLPFYHYFVGLLSFAFRSMVQKRQSAPPSRCYAEIQA